MFPRPIAFLTVWLLMYAAVAAEPPEIHESLLGNWLLETAEHNGLKGNNITMITSVEFAEDSLLVRNKIGKTFKYKYKLGKDKTGCVIDLLKQYGDNQDSLIPSRFSLTDGRLLLMLPAYSVLPQLRPTSVKSLGNGEFIVLHLNKSEPPESTERDE